MFKYIKEISKESNLEKVYSYLNTIEEKYKKNASYWNLRGDIECRLNKKEESLESYNNSIVIEKTEDVFKKMKNSFNENNVSEQLVSSSLKEYITDDMKLDDSNKTILNKYMSNKKNIYYSKGVLYFEKNNNLVKELLKLDTLISKKFIIFVKYDKDYIWNVRDLIKLGYININILVVDREKGLTVVKVPIKYINYIKEYEREKVLTFHYYNAGDSNVYAMYSNIPKKYKDEYVFNIIKGEDYKDLSNIVLTPLISKIYMSGHGTFFVFPYPHLMYNLELNHGAIPIKTCGAMGNNVWYASPNHYKYLNKLCVSSELDMLMWCSFGLLDRDKFSITGTPRTDLLTLSDGRKNLEKLLNKSLKGKKIIFNMPTFHYHERTGRLEGDKELNDFIKIKDFNYEKFDQFLGENNYILITKAHYLDENIMKNKKKINQLKNIYAFSNKDLELNNLDLYEILNSADLLITDYSTIYADFVFMNKPSLFIISDIEEYRKNRGLALEPYEYWMAGYQITEEKDLYEKIKLTIEKDIFKSKREELKSVFFKYDDNKNCERVWNLIEQISMNKE